MAWYLDVGLGRAKELGYASDPLLTYHAAFLNGMITSPDYNPYLVGSYRMGVLKASSPRRWYASWAEVKSTYLSAEANRTNWHQGNPPNPDDYAFYAFAAAAFTADKTDGAAAWNWLNAHVRQVSTTIQTNPTWAILPRSAVSPARASCDLNSDGTVNILDVQLAIGQVLGISPCTNADLVSPGLCTVADLQRVIAAISGGACLLGL
jgi:hypothetical protein